MLSAPATPTRLFLDAVEAPRNTSRVLAPFSLIVQDLLLPLEATASENKAPFGTVREKKQHVMAQFVDTWRTHFGSDFYPAARLILPNRDARTYHVKDVALMRLVAALLGLQKGLPDHELMHNWRRAHHAKHRLAGAAERRGLSDFPLLVLRILARRRDAARPVASSVTVCEVNSVLDVLAQHAPAAVQRELLAPFVARLTVPEARFFFLMVLRESLLGFSERAFLEAWHPDAHELCKVCGDLRTVLWALPDPQTRLHADQLCVQMMHQFVPQTLRKLEVLYEELCRRMTAPLARAGKLAALVQMYDAQRIAGTFLIEEKLDGDRMLMHMAGGRFLWHTRRRRDYTLVYGETTHSGALTRHLADAFRASVHSVVLDGEMVAWSTDHQCLLPFGTLQSAAVQEARKQFGVVDVYEGNNSWPFYVVFDIVHLNGRDLTGLPLFYRKHLLTQVVREVPHRLEVLRWTRAATPADVAANMRRIVSANNEGIMVKSLLLKYRVHSRDLTWIKVKPEYLESFGENLDLVVIGKIGRVKTTYICALRDDEQGGTHKLFCAVANGFSRAVYRQIEARLSGFWLDFRKAPPPPDVAVFGARTPDYWVHPANLVVLEIKARSVERAASSPYAAGSTLHNLWCRAVREDKDYRECPSLQEYHALRRRYCADVHRHQHVNHSRRHGAHSREPSVDATPLPPVDAAPLPPTAPALFAGLTLVVATDGLVRGHGRVLAAAVRRAAAAYGASVRLDVRPGPHALRVVLVGEVTTPRVRRWTAAGLDVVRPAWVYECIRQQRLVPLEPLYVFCASSPALENALRARVDVHGDSYTEMPASARGLLAHLSQLPVLTRAVLPVVGHASEPGVGHEIAPFLGHASFFIVPRPGAAGAAGAAEHARIAARIERFAGRVVPAASSAGYVVVPASMEAAGTALAAVRAVLAELACAFHEHSRLPHIVGEAFLRASIAAGELADPETHRPASAGLTSARAYARR